MMERRLTDMRFEDWLRSHGCNVEVTQEDDGSGYTVIMVTHPLTAFDPVELTVVRHGPA